MFGKPSIIIISGSMGDGGNWFANKTVGVRHNLVRLLAPKLYLTSPLGTRPMIRFLKSYYGRQSLVGAEIGVAEGINAKRILDTLNMKKLFLVDPFTAWDHVNDFPKAKANLEKYIQAVFVKEPSDIAVGLLPDLDFVYIDGDHSYFQVKQDITNYYFKVKPYGVLGGHDFDINHLDGVVKAVREFVEEIGVRMFRSIRDWWIIKRLNE